MSNLYPLENIRTIREMKTAVSSIYETLESTSSRSSKSSISDLYPLDNVKTIQELKNALCSVYENIEGRTDSGITLKKTNLSVRIATQSDLDDLANQIDSSLSGKMNLVTESSNDNIAIFDAYGQVHDSGTTTNELKEIFFMSADIDFATMTISNESCTLQDVLDALDDGKDVRCSLNYDGASIAYGFITDKTSIGYAIFTILLRTNIENITDHPYMFTATWFNDEWTVEVDELARTSEIPTKTSELSNDSGFLTEHQSLTGYVPTSRTINGQQLTGDIVLNAASVSAATESFVLENITQGTAIYRGSYATKIALTSIAWQTTDPNAQYYVSNNDYAVVQDDESNNDECWRYIYVTGTGWTAQYMINESPLTNAQLSALNSGATSAIINSVAAKISAVTMNGITNTPINGVVDLGTVLTAHQSLTDYVLTSTNSALSTKVNEFEISLTDKADLSSKNFLDYTTTSTLVLSPEVDVYKTTLVPSGVSAEVTNPDVSSIPQRNSYFKFELEITVPTGVTVMTYPDSFEWLNEDSIPEPGLIEGKTIYLACRFDCSTKTSGIPAANSILVNCWRIK